MRLDLEDMRATHDSLVYMGLGDGLMSSGSEKEAIESYKMAGDFAPKDDQLNYVLGRIYSNAKYFDDAIKAFDRSTRANSDNAKSWRELGLAYRRRGEQMNEPEDFNKAIECLKKAVTLKPDDDDAYAIMGGLYKRLKEYKRSLANYTRAHSINPGSSYGLSNMASLLWHFDNMSSRIICQ